MLIVLSVPVLRRMNSFGDWLLELELMVEDVRNVQLFLM